MIAPSARPGKGGVYTIVGGKRSRHDGRVADECVRVWVVDDQASFRRATAATLAAMDDFVMAGEYETGESAIELIPDGDAGIVLMEHPGHKSTNCAA